MVLLDTGQEGCDSTGMDIEGIAWDGEFAVMWRGMSGWVCFPRSGDG